MKKKYLVVLIIILNLIIISPAFADETDTFSSQKPDVLIIIDGSGSMVYEPSGADCQNTSNTSYSCGNKVYGDANCDNATFNTYKSSDSTRNTDCRKISIAQRAMSKILDNQKAKQIMRMGFMGFTNCQNNTVDEGQGSAIGPRTNPPSSSNGTYDPISGHTHSGCNYVRNDISDYYNSSTDNIFEAIRTNINNYAVTGGTVLVASLAEAKLYFTNYTDAAKDCRTKFVIVITDGDDTFACPSATGNELQKDQYKRRRESVAAVKALYDTFSSSTDAKLADEKIKTFVIGFGAAMPDWSENTLNWMAYYGQTSFSSTATVPTTLYYLDTTKPAYLYPVDPATNVQITACQDQAAYLETTSSYYSDHVNHCDGSHTGCVLQPNYTHGGHTYNEQLTDPGTVPLTGYAAVAANVTDLDAALASAFKVIEATYSFATSSVQSVRTKDENYIYEASFSVRTSDPFYLGHLKQYTINTDGTIPTNFNWDAGALLQTASASSRNIWTYKSTGPIAFTGDGSMSGNINYTDLGINTGVPANDAVSAGNIITFIRGGDITGTTDANNAWKLGDTFHSFPVTVGTPATYYCDNVDPTGLCCNSLTCQDPFTCDPPYSCCTCEKAFDIFRGYHQRSTVKYKQNDCNRRQ